MSVYALIMAAGEGARMGLGVNKALFPLRGIAMVRRAVEAFSGLVDGTVVVTRAEDVAPMRALSMPAAIVEGGKTRQQSVLHGLRALPPDAEYVLVHDAARPFVTADVIRRCVESVQLCGSGVASVPVHDTIKRIDASASVLETPPRDSLRAAQTPQAFPVLALTRAIEALESRGETATDDAAAMEAFGYQVALVEGSPDNKKLTTASDLEWAQWYITKNERNHIRVGTGYDAHRLVENRPLVLCGVVIPFEKGLLGHSDADVALHALIDAMLGAAAMGDIGMHFPARDPAYKGASSANLLRQVVTKMSGSGFFTQQADITIVAEGPRLSPFIQEMRECIAKILSVPLDHINVKATTTEGLGFEGEGKGISAHAVVSVLHWNPAAEKREAFGHIP